MNEEVLEDLDLILFLDIDAGRLDVAKQLGATYILQVKTKDTRELARQIEEVLGCRSDQTIECSGAQSAIATAIYVRTNGCIMYY